MVTFHFHPSLGNQPLDRRDFGWNAYHELPPNVYCLAWWRNTFKRELEKDDLINPSTWSWMSAVSWARKNFSRSFWRSWTAIPFPMMRLDWRQTVSNKNISNGFSMGYIPNLVRKTYTPKAINLHASCFVFIKLSTFFSLLSFPLKRLWSTKICF